MDQPRADSRDLVARAARGDDAAVHELLARHLDALQRFLRRRSGALLQAKESSADLVQSVCREVLEHADRFEHGGESGFRHWLYCTAMRKLADRDDYHRAHRRDVARERPAGDEDGLAATYATVCTPSRVAIAREQLTRLEQAFGQLSEPQREVVLGARLLGLSHAELATQLGRTESAVRTLLCRSLARLSQILADAEESASR